MTSGGLFELVILASDSLQSEENLAQADSPHALPHAAYYARLAAEFFTQVASAVCKGHRFDDLWAIPSPKQPVKLSGARGAARRNAAQLAHTRPFSHGKFEGTFSGRVL